MRKNKIYFGDCLQIMKHIPDKYIDCIICDLPYGTTKCKWDVIIPFDLLWNQYNRIIKDHGAIVLFGSEIFSSYLRLSNIKNYKYDWIWNKVTARGHLVAKLRPLQQTENISVFCKNKCNYYPQMEPMLRKRSYKEYKRTNICGSNKTDNIIRTSKYKYPKNILTFSNANSSSKSIHPTQKPVDLFEYLIKTYTKEQDLILDNCIGSGTTAIAAINTNRNWIGIEKDEEYFQKSKKRIKEHLINRENTFF